MEVKYYSLEIRTFITSLDEATQAKVVRGLTYLATYGNYAQPPISKSLGRGLFELRTLGAVNVRLLYAFRCGGIIILHAFIKKSDRILTKDLFLTRARLKRFDLL